MSDLQNDVSDIQDDITAIQSTLNNKVDSSSLATVATSWNASDLNNDAWFITSSYVGNWQITITQWGSNKWSFTLNQSWASTINVDAWITYLTQAQYDALWSSKLTNWMNYFIIE